MDKSKRKEIILGLHKEAKVSLDLEVGDVILTGRYKNKRKVVEELGTDELGMPTVNGQKLLAIRIEKLLPKKLWSSKSLAEMSEKEATAPRHHAAKELIKKLRERRDPEGIETEEDCCTQEHVDLAQENALKAMEEKEAGKGSSIAGTILNPVNLVSAPIGTLSSMVTPRLSLEEVSKINAEPAWKDFLIPGRAAYYKGKLVGALGNHPEIDRVRDHLQQLRTDGHDDDYRDIDELGNRIFDKAWDGTYHLKDNKKYTMQKVLELIQHQRKKHKYLDAQKEAGINTEIIGRVINPLTVFGTVGGMAAGGFTDTLDAEGMKEMDKETWKNILIPGRAGYNRVKRIGYMRDLQKRIDSEDKEVRREAFKELIELNSEE